MAKDIRKLISEINKGKNIEDNLPVFIDLLADSYRKTAVLHMAMNYDTLFEQLSEQNGDVSSDLKETVLILEQCMKDYFSSAKQTEQLLEILGKQRDVVNEKMQVLTAYVDRLSNYEYVLNRKEPEFETGTIREFDEEEFLSRLRVYLFKEKDPVVANNRIREVVGQLPVRMAKSKFYDILGQSIGLYKNQAEESLDSFLYMIRTSGSLYQCDGMERYFLKEGAALRYFDGLDYDSMDADAYRAAVIKLKDLAIHFGRLSDDYVSTQQLINEAMVILYTDFRKEHDSKFTGILEKELSLLSFSDIFSEDVDVSEKLEEASDLFVFLEGEQESVMERKDRLEAVLSEASTFGEVYSEFKEKLIDLNNAGLLLTNSVFVELSKELVTGQETEQLVSDFEAKEKTKELVDEFDSFFGSHTKRLNRAIMANTLSKVPVFFDTAEEVTGYVTNAVTKCTDMAEKKVCMHLINELLEECGL